jgi:hypothetical protein
MNNFDIFFGKYISALLSRGIATRNTIVGCTEIEIEYYLAKNSTPAPDVYLSFLRLMGKNAGRLFRGTDFFYPAILDLQTHTVEMLENAKNKILLPDRSLVFSMHQGYEICFFPDYLLSNPPVYCLSECSSVYNIASNTFTEFLELSLNDLW